MATMAAQPTQIQAAAVSISSANNFSVNSVNGLVLDRAPVAQLSVRSGAAVGSVNNNSATVQQHLNLIAVNGNVILSGNTFRTK
jgi:hypothetical protein